MDIRLRGSGEGGRLKTFILHPLVAELVGRDRAHAPALKGLAVC